MAYSAYYPDLPYDTIVTHSAREVGRELAVRCPQDPLDGVAIALLLGRLGDERLLTVPATAAFRARLAENEPDGHLVVPVVIAQGLEDAIVLPEVTAEFVAARCNAGEIITFWKAPGQDHLSLVRPGSPLVAPLIVWTKERFAQAAAEKVCSETTIAG